MTETRNYNFIYSKLVNGESDIFGAIAYSVYKSQKVETIRGFERKNGHPPTEQDLKPFQDLSNSESQIKFYKDQAFQLAQYFLGEMEPEISQKIYQDVLKNKPSFWYGVFQGVVASFISVLLVGLIFFFTLSYNKGFEGAVENFFNIQIEHVEKQQ